MFLYDLEFAKSLFNCFPSICVIFSDNSYSMLNDFLKNEAIVSVKFLIKTHIVVAKAPFNTCSVVTRVQTKAASPF